MKGREYLEDIRDRASEILTLTEAINKLMKDQIPPIVSAVDYTKEKIQTPSSTRPASSVVSELCDRINELQERKEQLKYKQLEASKLIDKVKESKLWTLLYCRYILNYDWMKIKDRLNCTERYVYFLHKKALDSFEKIFVISCFFMFFHVFSPCFL